MNTKKNILIDLQMEIRVGLICNIDEIFECDVPKKKERKKSISISSILLKNYS